MQPLDPKSTSHLETAIGYQFNNMNLLEKALVHKSYAFEAMTDSEGHNERMELLGDAVLDLVITDLLLKQFPEKMEGELSKLRASIVNEAQLATLAQNFDLGSSLLLGKGEERTHGRNKKSILADTYEALIAAVYLDGGFETAFQMISSHFRAILLRAATEDIDRDYKTRLQEFIQIRYKTIPHYRVTKELGPDHNKVFHVSVSVSKKTLAFGSGKNKKEAEQQAAKSALHILETPL
ncbi:MAG: ribonuclease III [Deltaproteobacteria bacterium]|nr:ribonuclease III [Deltaproteobacteria bacterium]